MILNEEYLSAAEIRKKIADLKIRLAFQEEFEEELAECERAAGDTDQAAKEQEARILREIAAETKKRARRRVGRERSMRAVQVAAMAAVLLTISFGSALAAIRMVEAGILRLDVRINENGTIFRLVEMERKVEVPEGWRGKYYPSYIPEGYLISSVGDGWVAYKNGNGQELYFDESIYGYRKTVDTENSIVSRVTLNGVEAMVVEKVGRTIVVWSSDDRYFIISINENREVALRIAASVDLYE